MGIKGLTKFISDNAPSAIRQQEISSYLGRVLAVDASMTLYQFMIAIRDSETHGALLNAEGQETSHINGMLSRVIRLCENGIKPVYVFDGKPPQLKDAELAKRREQKAEAVKQLEAAREEGDDELIRKFMRRTVTVTPQHNEDIIEMLTLLGLPVVRAPCEAEAQCAVLCKADKVYGVATEDADALTFGTKYLIRHLNVSEAKAKQNPILAISLEETLARLEFTREQFVDFCILCGCDYTDQIRGIGPSNAYRMIKQHKSIEGVLENLDPAKYSCPVNFNYKVAREFFLNPEVTDPEKISLVWSEPKYDELRTFLVEKHSFNAARVDSSIQRLQKARQKTQQRRLENFFGPVTMKRAEPKKAEPKKKLTAVRKSLGKKAKKT